LIFNRARQRFTGACRPASPEFLGAWQQAVPTRQTRCVALTFGAPRPVVSALFALFPWTFVCRPRAGHSL